MSFSRTAAGLSVYHLLEWSNLNVLLISQWITLPTLFRLKLVIIISNYFRIMSFNNFLKISHAGITNF